MDIPPQPDFPLN